MFLFVVLSFVVKLPTLVPPVYNLPIYFTYWGRMAHISVGNLTIIGSDNGLSPGRHQAIIWTNVGILLIGPLGTNFIEILIKIHTLSFKEMHSKCRLENGGLLSRPQCVKCCCTASGIIHGVNGIFSIDTNEPVPYHNKAQHNASRMRNHLNIYCIGCYIISVSLGMRLYIHHRRSYEMITGRLH